MTNKMKSLVKGVLAGLVGKPLEFSPGEPAEKWETIWEGIATTERSVDWGLFDHTVCSADLIKSNAESPLTDFCFIADDKVRITVDGNSFVYIAELDTYYIYGGYRAGNKYLVDALEPTDSGGDFAVGDGRSKTGYGLTFYSRNPGTYSIKIEALYAERVPVVYFSYNGVKLPELPDWDKDQYPHAVIVHHPNNFETTRYILEVFTHEPIYFEGNLSGFELVKTVPWKVIGYRSNGERAWEKYFAEERTVNDDGEYRRYILMNVGSNVSSDCVWTNVDLVKNGSIYKAASNPTPIDDKGVI